MAGTGNCQQKQRTSRGSPTFAVSPAAICGRVPQLSAAGCQGFMNQWNLVEILERIREPVAEYQEKRGLAKNEQFGFVNLVTALSQHAYNAILTIFSLLSTLFPLLEGLLYLVRFIIDKLLEICQSQQQTDKILKSVLFIGEMVVILLMMMIICGFILFPVWHLFNHMLGKVWSLFIRH